MITVDFKKVNIGKGYKILDIGCGSGRHTCEAYRFERVIVIGADLNRTDLETARSRLILHDELSEHGGGSWALSMADITKLPFKNECFDLVICSEVLEHIPDHKTAAKELLRVLKTGKNLAVSVPRYFPEKICWCLSDEYFNANQGHIRIYKKKQLTRMIEAEGSFCFSSHFSHSIHTPYWWLKCLVGPNRKDVPLVNLYHRLLTWDIMKKPAVIRFTDRLLNPVMGKSLVLYFKKHL